MSTPLYVNTIVHLEKLVCYWLDHTIKLDYKADINHVHNRRSGEKSKQLGSVSQKANYESSSRSHTNKNSRGVFFDKLNN